MTSTKQILNNPKIIGIKDLANIIDEYLSIDTWVKDFSKRFFNEYIKEGFYDDNIVNEAIINFTNYIEEKRGLKYESSVISLLQIIKLYPNLQYESESKSESINKKYAQELFKFSQTFI